MRLSNLIFFILIFILSTASAQNINQLDSNGKRHGIWKKYFDDTNVLRYEGTFNHGKEIGEFKFYKNINNFPILAATKVFSKNDNISEVKFYNNKGQVISEGKMNGRKYVGTWKYYKDGSEKLLSTENYNEQGQLHGKRLVYYKNGQIAEEAQYINGAIEGVSRWYGENNVVLKAFTYKNNELHGEAKYYNPKGELITRGRYKNGKKDGIWKFYENGKLVKEEDFSYKPKYIKVDGKYKKAP